MATLEVKKTPLNSDNPESPPPRMVKVMAPATLPAGYIFQAQVKCDPNGEYFSVQVPEGGVTEGQVFLVPHPSGKSERPRIKAPKGHWKDGLFDCLNAGSFHPSLWMAIFCPFLLMAQVMMRMRLTWRGEYGRGETTRNTFKIILGIVTVFIAFLLWLQLVEWSLVPYSNRPALVPARFRRQFRGYIPVLRVLSFIFFGLWALYSLCMTRESVRVRYSIRQSQNYCGCEDLLCATCCTCCTVAQMARHTGEYETYPGVFFSETGHPRGTPLV